MGKPIIRHCKNCQYYGRKFGQYDCQVRYVDVLCQRLRALLCRFYKKVEE